MCVYCDAFSFSEFNMKKKYYLYGVNVNPMKKNGQCDRMNVLSSLHFVCVCIRFLHVTSGYGHREEIKIKKKDNSNKGKSQTIIK